MNIHSFIKKTVIPLLLLLPMLSGCTKDEEPLVYAPALTTGGTQEVTRFKATLSGSAVKNPKSIADCDIKFLFSNLPSLADAEELTAVAGSNNLYTTIIDNLLPGNTYYYCICAQSGNGWVKGDISNFSTLSGEAPVMENTVATNVTEKSVTFGSTLLDNGGFEITQRGFAYKIYQEGMPEPTTYDKTKIVPSTSETFTVNVADLQAQSIYIVRAFAINKSGTGYGPSVTFTTENLKTPQITCSVGTLTAFAAQVSATISTNGGFAVIERGFCWSSESRMPTIANLKEAVSTDRNSYQFTIDNLDAKTTYYLRAYATNEKGTGYSSAIEFTTQEQQVVTLVAPTSSGITISGATLNSTMTVPAGTTVTEKGICYSMFSTKPAIDGTHAVDKSTENTIQATLTDLGEGSTYYATAYAVTRDGTFYSAATQFTTDRTHAPTLSAPELGAVTETTAKISATISSDGGRAIDEKGICWSNSTSTPTVEDSFIQSTDAKNTISGNLTELAKGTKYYARAYAKNVNGTSYSSVVEFTTAITDAPEVTDMTMAEIKDDNVTAAATLLSNGGLAITERGFVWSATVASPSIGAANVTKVVSTSKESKFTAIISGLAYNSRYYIAAYAINSKGTSYSTPISFSTSATYTAYVTTSVDNESITGSTAMLNGLINNDGGAEITECGFCWSESLYSPTLEDSSSMKATLTDKTFTATLSNLKAYHYYYVRAYAKNKNGVSYSTTTTFWTQKTTPGGDDNPLPDAKAKARK